MKVRRRTSHTRHLTNAIVSRVTYVDKAIGVNCHAVWSMKPNIRSPSVGKSSVRTTDAASDRRDHCVILDTHATKPHPAHTDSRNAFAYARIDEPIQTHHTIT
jgi:hypothetical protein